VGTVTAVSRFLSVPYTRIMTQGKTKVIYNSVPVGKYWHYVVDALYQSIDSILAQGKKAHT